MADSGKKQGLFSRIETREDALKLVRSGSIGFLLLAGLQALIGFFLFPAMLIDAAILAVLGFIVMKAHSRVAAVILLLVAGAQAVVTLLNRIGVMSEGGKNIILAAIMLILAIRLVEATFKLNGKFATPGRPQPLPGRTPIMSRPGGATGAR